MTHRSDGWRALLHQAHDVEQLSSELTRQAAHNRTVDGRLQRRYLVLRAALADRAAPLQQETDLALSGEVDASLAALSLLQWDREHGTGRGPVAATDPRWDADPLRYVHQEHAALVLDDPDQPRG
ncbi:hypothetical protein OIE82_35930 (plasmid) [Streptomyces althioticus]|uniref:Uncharacterized protein n=1 Tax=Streptomyces althioticus TaxID=83380 RepID=A0ABZ1YI29_9ACTN